MSYPNYPDNRLIVGGVDLTETFKMILVDGYTLQPPSIKTYLVDIPGGNGKLDLTESLFGDVTYDNRKQEFTHYVIDIKDFESIKTEVSNFLHGRVFDYNLTWDSKYTYRGRFSVSSYIHTKFPIGIVGCIKIAVEGDPFKHKEKQIYNVDAVGGNIFKFPSGRKRVRPTIVSDSFVKIIHNSQLITLPAGEWTVNDLIFTNGINEVYINSYDIHNLVWGKLKTDGVTWGKFKDKCLYEWYKSEGNMTIETKKWSEISGNTWRDLSASTWRDLRYVKEISGKVKMVGVQYDWGDL